MQESAHWERRISWVVFGAITALAAITPLGQEATHPLILVLYRALLMTLIVAALWGATRSADGRRVCPYFLGAAGLLGALLALSVWLEPGSRFEGTYVFYKNALYGAAFLAVAAYSRRRTLQWKQALLIVGAAIGVVHLAAALIFARGSTPLFGPFTNPNYFAS
ncbi:MAG TPA: hypothetical protein VFY29_19195, partial [Terriglobia bacterium]|nr:hypothetical protein [Terriglobia bacterium]